MAELKRDILDYRRSEPRVNQLPSDKKVRNRFMARGCLAGGCLMPTMVFGVAMYFHDLGGPLFFPMLCVGGAAIGLVMGLIIGREVDDYRARKLRRMNTERDRDSVPR